MLDRFERFVSSVSNVSRSLHRIMNDEMEQYGLKGTYAVYLSVLSRNIDGVTAAQLCESCEKNKAAVSRTLLEMEQLGLISRENSNYRAKIQLTERGQRAADYVCTRAISAVERAGKDLSAEQRETFYFALESIAKNLQTMGTENRARTEKGDSL